MAAISSPAAPRSPGCVIVRALAAASLTIEIGPCSATVIIAMVTNNGASDSALHSSSEKNVLSVIAPSCSATSSDRNLPAGVNGRGMRRFTSHGHGTHIKGRPNVELRDVMRTTPATREFTDDDLPDDILYGILDDARFAPNGSNRQAWRVIVVRDPEKKRRIADLYELGGREYAAHTRAGLVP